MLRYILPLLLLPSLALAQTSAQNGASVMVVNTSDNTILAANNIDDFIPANFAGRLAFSLLVHEWIAMRGQPLDVPLPNASDMTVGQGLVEMLDDGRRGEMARATLASLIGYTPSSMTEAMTALMQEMAIDARGFGVQRSAWGGPEWTGSLRVRDMGRLAIALTTLHPNSTMPAMAGADLQCMARGPGPKTQTPLVALVSGAASPQGCIDAAQSALALTDDRLERTVQLQAPSVETTMQMTE